MIIGKITKTILITSFFIFFFSIRSFGDLTHTTKKGEDLFKIAEKYYGDRSKCKFIAFYNKIFSPEDYKVGEKINIPGVSLHKILPGDSIDEIAERYLKSSRRYKFILSINGLNDPGQLITGNILKIPVQIPYRIKDGESLTEIAEKFYHDRNKSNLIADYNFFSKDRELIPGEEILIPVNDLEIKEDLFPPVSSNTINQKVKTEKVTGFREKENQGSEIIEQITGEKPREEERPGDDRSERHRKGTFQGSEIIEQITGEKPREEERPGDDRTGEAVGANDQEEEVRIIETLNSDKEIMTKESKPENEAGKHQEKSTYNDLQNLFQEKKYDECLSGLNSFIEEFQENGFKEQAAFLIGDCYFKLAGKDESNYQLALDAYRAALRQDPDSNIAAYGWFMIGESYRNIGLYYEAEASYSHVINKYSDSEFAVKSMLGKAKAVFQQKKYRKVISDLEKLLDRYPEGDFIKEVVFLIAISYHQIGDIAMAKNNYEKVVARWPDYPNTHPKILHGIGKVYYESDNFDLARKYLFKAINLFPGEDINSEIIVTIGDSYFKEEREKMAMKMYLEASFLYPGSKGDLMGRQRIANFMVEKPEDDIKYFLFGNEGDLKLESYPWMESQPLEIYRRIIEEHPLTVQAKNALQKTGDYYLKNGNYHKATTTYKRLLDDHPGIPLSDRTYSALYKSFSGSMNSYYEQNKYLSLINTYQINQNPYLEKFKNGNTLLKIGESYEKLGLFAEALELYQKISRLKEFEENAKLRRGEVYLMLGDYSNAERVLCQFTLDFPDSHLLPAAEHALADTLYLRGEFKRAIPLYLSSHKKEPKNIHPRSYFCLGNSFKHLGMFSQAVDAYRNSIRTQTKDGENESSPEFIVECYFQIADNLFNEQRYQDALEAYLSAIKIYPQDKKSLWARYQTGRCYEKMGMGREARNIFGKMISTSSDKFWREAARAGKNEIYLKEKYRNYLAN